MGSETKTLQWEIPKALRYPVAAAKVLLKRKALKRELLTQSNLVQTRIAILGGSTTSEVKSMLELFLLAQGIQPTFYESQYNSYSEEVLFESAALWGFKPDIVFIHTTWRNVAEFPEVLEADAVVEERVRRETSRFERIWEKVHQGLDALIIQNNFDLPRLRPLGNLEASAAYGRANYLLRLNGEFAAYSRTHSRFLINDILYLSSRIGLSVWEDDTYWYNFHMAVGPQATVFLAQNVAAIVKAVYGKTKKCLVLDLDNTLWGGVIGDDGVQNLVLGRDHPMGEAFLNFQRYVKDLRRRGIILAICSKNEPENAKEGLSHPDSVLKLEDFSAIKANWNPKPDSLREIAVELNIGLDSLVFVDDNPAERALVASQIPEVAVPEVGSDITRFAEILEQEHYFDVEKIVPDDLRRSDFYSSNAKRSAHQLDFKDYGEFLSSLEMTAEIGPFVPVYLERITQLTNKTNQFNLTTRRYTSAEVEAISRDPGYITVCGRLIDRFGDNGLVSIVIARLAGTTAEVDLWLMSCRVLKREMENAMFDALVEQCQSRGIREIVGAYIPTKKNKMVAGHYGNLGFVRVDAPPDGPELWRYEIPSQYSVQTRHIQRLALALSSAATT